MHNQLAAAITEREFQQQVTDLAQLKGFHIYHTFDSRRSAPGFPDLVMCCGRRLIFAELKAERGRLTRVQRIWLGALTATGVEVYIWRPSDWDQVVEILSRPCMG